MERSDIQGLFQEEPSDLEAHIMEMEQELGNLEKQVLSILETLPDEHRAILESYLYQLAELEACTVVHAFKKGKEAGQKTRRARKNTVNP